MEYFSYLAYDDPCRRGIAISMFAQCMKHAMNHFRESRVKKLMKEDVYAKVNEVVDQIYPHLEVLDGGPLRYGKGFKGLAYDSVDGKLDTAVEEAGRAVYAWLTKEQDPFSRLSASLQRQRDFL